MRVEFRPEARDQAAERRRWWTENRPAAPELFDEELAAAVADLGERAASIPAIVVRDGVAVRRWLLPKTRCHLYYVVDEARDVVDVVALWGATMGRRPPLAKGVR